MDYSLRLRCHPKQAEGASKDLPARAYSGTQSEHRSAYIVISTKAACCRVEKSPSPPIFGNANDIPKRLLFVRVYIIMNYEL